MTDDVEQSGIELPGTISAGESEFSTPKVLQGLEFQTVRSTNYFLEGCEPGTKVSVTLRGLIVKRKWSQRKSIGVSVRDLTGEVLVVVPFEDGKKPTELTVGSRIWLTGLGRREAEKGLVVVVESFRSVSGNSLVKPHGTTTSFRPPAHIVDAYLLARLRHVGAMAAHSMGYEQFEPFYLSLPGSRYPEGALRVSFEGWGGDVLLATSPTPQLLEILLATGETRVFSIARCFSFAYRDGFTSAEKLVLAARELNATMDSCIEFAIRVVSAVLTDADTSPDDAGWVRLAWRREEVDDFDTHQTEAPTVRFSRSPPSAERGSQTVFVLVAPPNLTVAEGDVTDWAEDITIGAVTVYLERIMSLLSIRRMSQLRRLDSSDRSTGVR